MRARRRRQPERLRAGRLHDGLGEIDGRPVAIGGDDFMVDIVWNGFSRSRDMARLAGSYELNVAPLNRYPALPLSIGTAYIPTVR